MRDHFKYGWFEEAVGVEAGAEVVALAAPWVEEAASRLGDQEYLWGMVPDPAGFLDKDINATLGKCTDNTQFVLEGHPLAMTG